jgi:hypothetical protein
METDEIYRLGTYGDPKKSGKSLWFLLEACENWQ